MTVSIQEIEKEIETFLINIKNKYLGSILPININLTPGITGKFIIVGDLHGNLNDLLYIIKSIGELNENNQILFLGDYVDRGNNSILVLFTILKLFNQYPNYVHLLRGNHECKGISKKYGFLDNCHCSFEKYDDAEKVFEIFTSIFPYFHIGSILNFFNEKNLENSMKIFCVHGGISKTEIDLQKINEINYQNLIEISDNEIISDLLWSDPQENPGFLDNSRGIGNLFGPDKFKEFLNFNNLNFIIRAHELCYDGFNRLFNKKLLTLFSASNYCNLKNYGAFLKINYNEKINFKIDVYDNEKTKKFESDYFQNELFNKEFNLKYFQ